VNLTEIHRYLSGEASEAEQREFELWLSESSENRQQFEMYKDIYEVEPGKSDRFDANRALVRFQKVLYSTSAVDKVQLPEPTGSRRQHDSEDRIKLRKSVMPHDRHFSKKSFHTYQRRRRRNSGVWLKIAALLLLVVGTSIYLNTSIPAVTSTPAAELVHDQIITTRHGEKKRVHLADGTEVMLNAGSELQIPSDYGVETRQLTLRGEAFFDVVSLDGQGFTVETQTAQIRVVGTSFSVRSWDQKDESVIAVRTGVVSVASSNSEIDETALLEAGEFTIVKKDEKPVKPEDHSIDQYLGWTEQRLIFEETPLNDVIHQLELHFDVKIQVDDSTSITEPVTASFKDESLQEILEYTSIIHEVTFKVY